MDNTHEWCAEGVEPQMQYLQGQSISPFPWAAERMARHEVINVTRVSELPEEASAEKAMFQAQGIQSVMNIPMVYGEKLIGLIGFDAVRHERFWTEELVSSLRIVGEIFANALARKRADRALQESEERLLQLAENINEVLWMESVDANRLIYVSPVYEKVWGRSRESLLAHPSEFINYIQEDDRDNFKAHLGKQRRGEISETEYRIIRPDGSVRWIWDRGFPIRNGDGHIYRSAGISEDITERKQAEAARRESEERFRNAFQHAPIGMVLTAGDGRFLQVNRRICEMLGYADTELLGMTFQNVTHPDDQQPSVGLMHKLLAGEIQSAQFDKRYLHKHGPVVWAHVSVSVLRDLQGKPLYFVTQIQDITERKQLEEQLRHYTVNLEKLVDERTTRIQELERQRVESEKLATTGRMAARIAHEINNPLAGIKNSFLLVKDAIPSTHQHYEYVGRIEREIDRIARIIRQMFDLYRQEQDEVSRFRADDAIHDVIALLEPSFREHSVTCEGDVEKAAIVVALPEGLLRQVLYNIIQNAIEASPAGGVVKVVAIVTDDVMNISIADQGSGISEEARSRIFEPFFTTKSKLTTGGLGLGLSVSKSLVESMRGTLAFETKTGAGTVFRIVLPLGAN
jgi:PAS domain S-box-containing protein